MEEMNLDTNSIVVVVKSPQQLEQILAKKLRSEILMGKNVILVLDDKKYILSTFSSPLLRGIEINQYIYNKAMELTNLTSAEIALDFQILNTERKVKGVFACIPLAAIDEYNAVLEKYCLHVLKIIPGVLARLEVLLTKKPISDLRVVYVDFIRDNEIDIVVMNGRHIELLRRCPYEKEDQAFKEIDHSLKSVCSHSARKTFDKIFVVGQNLQGSLILAEIKKHFDAHVELVDRNLLVTNNDPCGNIFSVNLSRNLYINPKTKKLFARGLNLLLVACFALISLFTFNCIYIQHQVSFWEKAIAHAEKL